MEFSHVFPGFPFCRCSDISIFNVRAGSVVIVDLSESAEFCLFLLGLSLACLTVLSRTLGFPLGPGNPWESEEYSLRVYSRFQHIFLFSLLDASNIENC